MLDLGSSVSIADPLTTDRERHPRVQQWLNLVSCGYADWAGEYWEGHIASKPPASASNGRWQTKSLHRLVHYFGQSVLAFAPGPHCCHPSGRGRRYVGPL